MKFAVEYPMPVSGGNQYLLSGSGVRDVARVLEASGFDALCFSDHPAPSANWLESSVGHQTFDPLAALSFCAGVTNHLTLMTHCLVVPYRHPLVTAKVLATLDLVSEGRLIVVAGAGYLEAEFSMLNVDIDDRNRIFDESLSLIRSAWSGHALEYVSGTDSDQVACVPAPHTRGGPPIWIAGNSARSRRRAVGEAGWSPILVSEATARLIRTSPLTLEGLRRHVSDLRDQCERAGRPRPTVQVQTPMSRYLQRPTSIEQHREHLGQLAEAGVDSFIVLPPARSAKALVDGLEGYADDFVRARH
jgi:probable F420-dependent oxidoreductase